MKIHYIEIVTPEVDAICEKYTVLYNVEFKEKDQMLGGARTITLENGGMMGIQCMTKKSPLHGTTYLSRILKRAFKLPKKLEPL